MANKAFNIVPNLTGENTQAQLKDQGYTYNQAGFSYNQAGVMYGGIYNTNEDVIPTFSRAFSPVPTIYGSSDTYTKGNKQKTVGPGWFLYVSQ